MNAEKPEVQKIIIDMGGTRTESREKEVAESSKTTDIPQEKHLERFSEAKAFIKHALEQCEEFKGDAECFEANVEFWQDIEIDLECGNQIKSMEKLETANIRKEDLNTWRNAIFEISKESQRDNYLLKADEIGAMLYDEFTQRQSAMNDDLDKYPEEFTKQEIKDWDKDILRWMDAANEVPYGRSANTILLLEETINDTVERDHSWRLTMAQKLRKKELDIEGVNELREMIATNSKKLSVYRRLRDSLHSIESSK